MAVRSALCLLAALSWVTGAGRAQVAFPIPVFITHLQLQPLPRLEPEQHLAAIKATRAEMFDVAAKLRKQHGNKTSAWPPEVWNVFHEAEAIHELAVARRDYEPPETQWALVDSVEDIRRSVLRSKFKEFTIAESAESAALVVQITGRRRASPPGIVDPRFFIRFRVRPGALMSGDRFLEATELYKWDSQWTKLIARPKDASGFVDLEAASPSAWRNCADLAISTVLWFIRNRLDPAKKGGI